LRALSDIFARGELVRPAHDQPGLVALVRAIATLAGVPDLDHPDCAKTLARQIGPSDHLVFVLLDGLGMNIVRRLPASSFICSHLRGEIQATCPSTTACALTSVATGHWADRHGVTGWFTHLPEFNLTAMTLPFADRATGQPLSQRGIRVEDVLPLPALAPRMTTHQPCTLTPSYIAHTPFNGYARGNTRGSGYEDLKDAIDQLITRVLDAKAPTYTHLYLHDIDTLCHHVGVEHDSVVPLVLGIDSELRRLADALEGRARIVISADHGLIDVPRTEQTLLFQGDPLLDVLQVPPTGDARMPLFHLREGQREAFVEQFAERFAEKMTLLSIEEADQMRLFGPGPLSPVARRRFGDFVAIPFRPATLAYHPPHKPPGELYLAVHAGLSPQEMWVPLCIA
jgi:hypothetical protein